jgi:hypothetical protein
MKISRRTFAAAAGIASAAAFAASAQQTTPTAQGPPRRPMVPDTPPFEAPLEFTSRAVALRAEPFPMSQVTLLPGIIYHDAQEWNRPARYEATWSSLRVNLAVRDGSGAGRLQAICGSSALVHVWVRAAAGRTSAARNSLAEWARMRRSHSRLKFW